MREYYILSCLNLYYHLITSPSFNDLCCFLIVNAFVFSPSFFLIIKSYEMLLTYWTSYFLPPCSSSPSIWYSRNVFGSIFKLFSCPMMLCPRYDHDLLTYFPPLSMYNKLCCSMNKISHYICLLHKHV